MVILTVSVLALYVFFDLLSILACSCDCCLHNPRETSQAESYVFCWRKMRLTSGCAMQLRKGGRVRRALLAVCFLGGSEESGRGNKAVEAARVDGAVRLDKGS